MNKVDNHYYVTTPKNDIFIIEPEELLRFCKYITMPEDEDYLEEMLYFDQCRVEMEFHDKNTTESEKHGSLGVSKYHG